MQQCLIPDCHCPAMPQVTAVDDQFGTHTARWCGCCLVVGDLRELIAGV